MDSMRFGRFVSDMRKIRIFDTTLRDGEQAPGCSLYSAEKCEMAHRLERLGVDVIEAGFAASSKGDAEAISAVCRRVEHTTVASLARANRNDIDAAYEALRDAADPLIHVFISTSDLHMEHKLHMTREEVLNAITESAKYARSLCPNVEYSFEDATRTDREFLVQATRAAINAGVSVVNIPDTVGYALPEEITALFGYLFEQVPELSNVILSAHCHNDMGLAVANSIAAVTAGAGQIECAVNGIGERAGNASLEETVMALETRKDFYKAETNIVTTQLCRASRTLSRLTGIAVAPNKAIVGINAFAHEAGIHQHGMLENRQTYEIISPESVGAATEKFVLGKHSGRHAFDDYLRSLGYDFDKPRQDRFFAEFKRLCDRKKEITPEDIEAIIMHKSADIPERYALSSYIVNCGNMMDNTAIVTVTKDGEEIKGVSLGDGPVDAAFKAVESITGISMQLDDYSIKSVSEGADALGEVTIRVTHNGSHFVGKGLSTDIIKASIRAYINASNRVLASMQEGEKTDA